jgi:hypothetical protein
MRSWVALGLAIAAAVLVPARTLAVSRESAPEVETSSVSHEAYGVDMKAQASYAPGKEGSVDVVISAKGEFKINPQFPFRLKLAEPPEGVAYPKPVLKKDDGTFSEKQGSFKVPFVAQKAGTYTVSCTVSLSVCNDKKCLMEKVPVDVQVTVK